MNLPSFMRLNIWFELVLCIGVTNKTHNDLAYTPVYLIGYCAEHEAKALQFPWPEKNWLRHGLWGILQKHRWASCKLKIALKCWGRKNVTRKLPTLPRMSHFSFVLIHSLFCEPYLRFTSQDQLKNFMDSTFEKIHNTERALNVLKKFER